MSNRAASKFMLAIVALILAVVAFSARREGILLRDSSLGGSDSGVSSNYDSGGGWNWDSGGSGGSDSGGGDWDSGSGWDSGGGDWDSGGGWDGGGWDSGGGDSGSW